MIDTRDLLVEIGTEELPPRALLRLSQAFTREIEEGLGRAGILFGTSTSYATPRRLAVWIEGVATQQPDKEVERRGPSLTAAFDEEGRPSKSALGFAASCGVAVEQLQKSVTDKGAWLVHRSFQQGRSTQALLPNIVKEALDRLPIPKRMRWGTLDTEFVRPVHWAILLFGEEVVDAEILGVRTDRVTRGHRFHHPAPLIVTSAAGYAPLLETEGHVIAEFAQRRLAIRAQVAEAAVGLNGTAVVDDELLDEVTGLVEWPVAVVGRFDSHFLEVPSEALISAMKGHQRYFHVVDDTGALLPYFVAVANIESRDPELVRSGNERVIRPRLTDAAFFWNLDRKTRLAERLDSLKSVVFQQKLGTLYDKSVRVSNLAGTIAAQIGGDPLLAQRAGLLSKCDLMTAMVGEFPELQGIMGRHYAQQDGEPGDVPVALDEQYLPRFGGDRIAATRSGQALAIADRLDTLVGIFGVGLVPSGDKDPFGLRRAALGVVRTIIENRLELDLRALLTEAGEGVAAHCKVDAALIAQVYDFTMERLRAYYLDVGTAFDTFEAVLARAPARPADFHRRIKAVNAFRALPEAESLAAANKRIANILRRSDDQLAEAVRPELLRDEAEATLFASINDLRNEVGALIERGEYEAALTRLARLRGPVDAFFDAVMVMTEEEEVRVNRLTLLKSLSDMFLEIADLSRFQGAA